MNKRRLSMRGKEMLIGYIFITPWAIGLVLFFFMNLGRSVQFSFSSVDLQPGTGAGYSLANVGFSNYRFALLEHATFVRVLTESVLETIISVPLIIFFSLFVAILINRKFALRGVVRAVFFLPVIMASPAINAALAGGMRAVMGGASNVPPDMVGITTGVNSMALLELLTSYGLPLQVAQYIADTVTHLFDIIRASGVQIIIFLAALQSVPGSLYEVAKIEGATAYETFWKITFPMVSPLVLTNVVYTIVDGFSRTEVIDLAFDMAFQSLQFGRSAAMSLTGSLVICAVLVATGYFVSRKVFYHV